MVRVQFGQLGSQNASYVGTRAILLVRSLCSFVNYVERGGMVDGIVEVRIEYCWLIFAK